jgi:TonB family protein
MKPYYFSSIIAVVSIHIVLMLIFYFGWPQIQKDKVTELEIEFNLNPIKNFSESSELKKNEAAIKNNKPFIKPQANEKIKSIDSLVKPEIKPQVQENKEGGGAPQVNAAPTTDADYKLSALNNPKPPYPPYSYKARQEGQVVLLVEVLATGESGQVSIFLSSGFELLDESALTTVKKWHFVPAKKDGQVIPQTIRVPITFSLKNF